MRTLYVQGVMLGLDLARARLPAVQGHRGIAEVPQGRKVRRSPRRRPDRPRQLSLQADRAGPPPRPGLDEAMRLRRPAPRCRSKTTSSRPIARRSPASVAAPSRLRPPFSHLVLKEELFNAIGPAIVSGRSVFIYGPPGNGKTSIARAIGEFMNNAGGEIYVPYAFLAENSIITVYDQSLHQLADDREADRMEDNEGDHPPAAQLRHRGRPLGQDPSARRRHRRRTEPRHARSALQRRRQLSTRPRCTSRPTAASS